MKVIKLNRRYKLYKEQGYQAGLRFNTWENRARLIEMACRERLGNSFIQADSDWYGYFGKRNLNGPTPYFIMFRRESDLSFVLLCIDLTKKD
jgi:hypothetical protein